MNYPRTFEVDSSSESSEEDLWANTTGDGLSDFQPRKKRRISRNPKEKAALGVFGSESEDERPGKKWKGRNNLREKGVRFVSHNNYEGKENEENDALHFEIKEDHLQPSSKSETKVLNSDKNYKEPHFRTSRVSTQVGTLSSLSPNFDKGHKNKQTMPENNTLSFAARMMAKMGYKEGQGLGKEGQGRSGVIEVTLRPQGVGLGAIREKSKQEIEEEKRKARMRGEKYDDPDEAPKKNTKKSRGIASQNGTEDRQKSSRKPKFRTIEEIQKLAPGLEVPESFISILDMTGPSQRLLTSAAGVLTSNPETDLKESSEMKKLTLVAQNDLSAYVEEWKSLEERKVYFKQVILQKRQEIEEKQQQFDNMRLFAGKFQTLSQPVKEMEWDHIIGTLETANSVTDSESTGRAFDLSKIAVAAVHPLLRQVTAEWKPLEDPGLGGLLPQLLKIRKILGANLVEKNSVDSDFNTSNVRAQRILMQSSTVYESMILKIIYPKILFAIDQKWDVFDPNILQALIDAWEELLPSFVRFQILNEAVVRKLNSAVSSWNPKKKRTHELPHLWLFPWLQYLPAHHADPKSSNGLVSDVKRKFRYLLESWDFRKGVVPGLQQWREVLYASSKNDQWTPLIMNHVLPSMSKFLKNENNFMINPNDQAPFMSSLQSIFEWQQIIKSRIVGQVIVDTIFPLWHKVLYEWLIGAGPNEEIGQWFEWWRHEVFPAEIKDLKIIQDEFDKGHEMIRLALDLGSESATRLPAPIHSSPKRPSELLVEPVVSLNPQYSEENSLRDRVEDWCIENDLQFLPEKKVLHPAGPLHRITAAGNGKNGVLIHIKGDNIWALSKKGLEQVEININWENLDARDLLLGMAWHNVK